MTIVRRLVRAGAELNQVDSDGTTALMFAAAQGHGDIVDMLLVEEADADIQDMKGLTALAWARARGQDAVARVLAFPDASSSAALLVAVERNDVAALERLLADLRKSGVSVALELSKPGKLKSLYNTQLGNDKMTPLMVAAYFGHAEMLAPLIRSGAKLDQHANDGMTALLWAAEGGHTRAVKRYSMLAPTCTRPIAVVGPP